MKISAFHSSILEAIKLGYNKPVAIAKFLDIRNTQVHGPVHILKKRGFIKTGPYDEYVATDQPAEIAEHGERGGTGRRAVASVASGEHVLALTEKLLLQLVDQVAVLKPMLISPQEREDYEQLKAMRETIDSMIEQSKPGKKRK